MLFQKCFLRRLYKASKFPFLVIVGPINIYIIHRSYQKRKLYSSMIIEVVMLAIKTSFFGNYKSHQVTKKGNFGPKWFLRWLCNQSKFLFLAIVGPIIAYIIYQIAKKRNFILKWFLGQLYQPSKISFFGNCGSHHCLYKPSKLPKKEILF